MTREALNNTPKASFLLGPSPIHPLPRLSEFLGGNVEVWAKREDLNSGMAYGGNKTRKLEYLAQDALNQGCDTLVSIGGVQSNHTRQVAAVAARLGLQAVLVQEHWVDWDEPHYDKTGNILLSRIMGAEVRLDSAGFDIGFRPSWEQAIADVEARGGKPYAIPAGASDHPLGGYGFANWAFEVMDQEKELGWQFDASATVEKTRDQITRIAKRTAKAIELGRVLSDDEVVLLDRWHDDIYGVAGPKTIQAIKTAARLEGMITDPVYEGKSMAALIDLVKEGYFAPGSKVLYAHLGGQPALNAYTTVFW